MGELSREQVDMKRKALTRLQGLDMAMLLDINGTGTVDWGVLSRTLKRFDEKVFTDEALSLVLDSGLGTPRMKHVRINNLASMVTDFDSVVEEVKEAEPQSAPGSAFDGEIPPWINPTLGCLLKAAEVFNATLDTYGHRLLHEIQVYKKNVGREVCVANKWWPGQLESLITEFKRKSLENTNLAKPQNITINWRDIDRNHDGILSPEECMDAINEYLGIMIPRCSEVIRRTCELGMEFSLSVLECKVQDADTVERMRTRAKEQLEETMLEVEPILEEQREHMASLELWPVVGEILEKMDEDENGEVTQQEFEAGWIKAIQSVVGQGMLMDTLHEISEGHTLSLMELIVRACKW